MLFEKEPMSKRRPIAIAFQVPDTVISTAGKKIAICF
jgi:hypothetical protein